MREKWVYGLVFVLVLGAAGGVHAADIQYTDAGADHLWTNAENWKNNSGPPTVSNDGAAFNQPDTKVLIADGMQAVCKGFMLGMYGASNEAEVSGGTLTCNWLDVGRVNQNGGQGYLLVTGGEIKVNGALRVPQQFTSAVDPEKIGVGHVDLLGGTIVASNFVLGNHQTAQAHATGGIGTMEVSGGTLIVNGDKTADIQGWINQGWISAWNDAGEFQLDYGITHSGKTTLRARPPLMADPYLLHPAENATDVQPGVILTWSAGAHVQAQGGHHVYIGTSLDAVETANRSSHPGVGYYNVDVNSVGPLSLAFDQTYYWRVDDVNTAHPDQLWSSRIGRFTVGSNALIDDMEYYGWEDLPGIYGSRIWYVWNDGEGWTNPAPGWGGNGTGASVELEQTTANIHTGEQSLKIDYGNSGTNALGSSGKAFYSEVTAAIADLPVGPAWASYSGKALELWFLGTAGNDTSQQMWVALEDASGASAIVEYHGNMADVALEIWTLWQIALPEFVDVDLDEIKSISIGFGLRDSQTPGGAGTVYVDDIRLYPCRPGALATDLNGDCVVDAKDLALLTNSWLSKKLRP